MEFPDAVPVDSTRELHDWLVDNWWVVLVAGSVGVVGLATVVKFAGSPFYIHKDSALFQHGGWYILNGGTLYVDIWDLKPPLIYWVSAVLALLSFGNMAVLQIYGIIAAVAAVSGGIIFVGLTAHRLTDDRFAALVAAGSMLLVTSLYTFPYAGIRPKYFAFLCGAGALYFALEDRSLASGVAAALAAGFWQLGGLLAFLVVAINADRGGARGAGRTIAGGLVVTVLTVLPFVLTGRTIPLFVEVVLGPIYGVERYTLVGRLLTLIVELGPGLLLVPIAFAGYALAIRRDWRTYWWVASGGGLYSLQIFLEFQGTIELVLFFVFLALGAGVLTAELSVPSRQSTLAGVLVVLILLSGLWAESSVIPGNDAAVDLQEDHDIPNYEDLPPDPPNSPSMQEIYWEKQKPDNCHYRLGHKQKYFEMVTGGSINKTTCGQWPYDREPLPWVLDALNPLS
ncbi:DolP-mannose mannosyltransferase [Halapricum desulfuricans]|uniref:Dolichol phosphate-mannose mannosyltransferase n=1 Tax=Halapricum desulfuricans TaxID=2841257 RepID=A0A897NXG6_9EURY|nr:DolP-mannose mannosyltransferase [Halapricum desulfuricans]QSG15443.1 Dolichol phosphate-mannose mannosyltransferase [Halapricum desulfuricans]